MRRVIASVKVNGKDCGILWQDPYVVDVTDVLKAGANDLEWDVDAWHYHPFATRGSMDAGGLLRPAEQGFIASARRLQCGHC